MSGRRAASISRDWSSSGQRDGLVSGTSGRARAISRSSTRKLSISPTVARAAVAMTCNSHHRKETGNPECNDVAIIWEMSKVHAKSIQRFARPTTATKARAVGPAAEISRAVQVTQPGKWRRVTKV